jgi:hypothetical protein
MGEPVNVVRMTISVPRELKERMEAAKESVNWSAVAARAFEGKLLELQSQREAKNMNEVVARLKAADELERSEEYQAGRTAGEAWAKEAATPRQLRRLVALAEDQYGITGHLHIFADSMNRGIGHGLADVMNPGQEFNLDSEGFWIRVLGDDRQRIEDEDFARGFVDAAREVWEAVKGKL